MRNIFKTLTQKHNKKNLTTLAQQEKLMQETIAAKEKLRQEVQQKNQQLATQASQLAEKNKHLEKMQTLAETIKTQQNLKCFKQSHKQLIKLVNYDIELDKDWKQFMILFEQTYPGFCHRLHQTYPQLSSNDIRYCTLLKINIPYQHMANLLGITYDSLRVKQYRLGKKIGLDKGDLKELIIVFE